MPVGKTAETVAFPEPQTETPVVCNEAGKLFTEAVHKLRVEDTHPVVVILASA